MPPASISDARRSRTDVLSGMRRATARPRSVITMVWPSPTSRTHSLNFALSSRIPIRRSLIPFFIYPDARDSMRSHFNICDYVCSGDTAFAQVDDRDGEHLAVVDHLDVRFGLRYREHSQGSRRGSGEMQ